MVARYCDGKVPPRWAPPVPRVAGRADFTEAFATSVCAPSTAWPRRCWPATRRSTSPARSPRSGAGSGSSTRRSCRSSPGRSPRTRRAAAELEAFLYRLLEGVRLVAVARLAGDAARRRAHLRACWASASASRARPTSPGDGSTPGRRSAPFSRRCFPRVVRRREGEPRVRDHPSRAACSAARPRPPASAGDTGTRRRAGRRPHRHRRVREGRAAGGAGSPPPRRSPARRSSSSCRWTSAREARQVVAGIAETYAPEALVGKTIVLVANLKPAKLMGVESNGMVLAGSIDGKAVLCTFDADVAPGHEGEVSPTPSRRRAVSRAAALSAALPGCPGRPKAVVYDLAARVAVAETWSAADVLRFGTPAAEPRLVDGFHREAGRRQRRALPLVEGRGRGRVPVGRGRAARGRPRRGPVPGRRASSRSRCS